MAPNIIQRTKCPKYTTNTQQITQSESQSLLSQSKLEPSHPPDYYTVTIDQPADQLPDDIAVMSDYLETRQTDASLLRVIELADGTPHTLASLALLLKADLEMQGQYIPEPEPSNLVHWIWASGAAVIVYGLFIALSYLCKIDEGMDPYLKKWSGGLEAGLIYGVFVVVLLWLVERGGAGSMRDGKKIPWDDPRVTTGFLKRLVKALVVGLAGSFTTTAIAIAIKK